MTIEFTPTWGVSRGTVELALDAMTERLFDYHAHAAARMLDQDGLAKQEVEIGMACAVLETMLAHGTRPARDVLADAVTSGERRITASRLEYLRGKIRAERISYGEIAELQSLVEHIDSSDVELLQWASEEER